MNSSQDCLISGREVPACRTRAHRILAAVEWSIPLPALVRRGGEPQPITLDRVIAVAAVVRASGA